MDTSRTGHFAYYLDSSPTDCSFCQQDYQNKTKIKCVALPSEEEEGTATGNRYRKCEWSINKCRPSTESWSTGLRRSPEFLLRHCLIVLLLLLYPLHLDEPIISHDCSLSAPYVPRGGNASWLICCLQCYINCVFVCLFVFLSFLPSFLTSFFPYTFFLTYLLILTDLLPDLFTSWLIYLLLPGRRL